MCEESIPGVKLGYMAMPRAVGSLSDYLHEVDETTLLRHVARGLTCLHSHNLVHGDIKVRSTEGWRGPLGVPASSLDEGPIQDLWHSIDSCWPCFCRCIAPGRQRASFWWPR